MRFIGYRWDELAAGCDPSSHLNVQWQRTFMETLLDGYSVRSFPGDREILVFEGEAEVIREIRKVTEDVARKIIARAALAATETEGERA